MASKDAIVKRLFFDLETSPNVVLSWRLGYKISIGHENLLRERAIICVGYKWQGGKVKVIGWDQNQSDKSLLEKLSKVIAQADEVVFHNGDRYDMPWVTTRCLFHDLPALPVVPSADTLRWARRKFAFNSNRLDYIAKFLGIGAKIKTEFGLWKEVLLNNDRSALGKMMLYCAHDVELLEQVWERLSQASPIKTHAGVLDGGEKWSCPRCTSENVFQNQRRVTAKGTVQFSMKCKDCNGFYSIGTPAHNKWKEEPKIAA
jgi:predicted PolB exonuclease-like 3'-5' exonuclease